MKIDLCGLTAKLIVGVLLVLAVLLLFLAIKLVWFMLLLPLPG